METAAASEPFRFHAAATSPAGAVAGTDALVQETRREIAAIVRQTAELARREQSLPRFFNALADRAARAMAAEGVVIWRRTTADDRFDVIARVGKTTDLDLQPLQIGCHQRMLHEVAEDPQPVVVPPTPGATDDTLPANPSKFPVALVPVLEPSADSAKFLLEVFLEPDGGPATQRGYLRFAAQMADLASDFLRLHRIRQSEKAEARWRRLAESLPRLHSSLSVDQVAACVVDEAAELFDVDRASLCRINHKRTALIAVSHVTQLHRKNEEARRIESWAEKVNPNRPLFHEESDRVSSHDSASEDPASGDPASGEPASGEPLLQLQAAVSLGERDQFALVLQSHQPVIWEIDQRRDLQTFAAHSGKALHNAEMFGAIPWARAASILAPSASSNTLAVYRQWLMAGVLAILIAIIACFPVPLVVHCEGELYAANAQSVYAPRDGVVSEVLVEHGQAVQKDQILVRMVDQQLEQQHQSLVGERAVLLQRSGEIRGALVGQSNSHREESQRLQGEQRIVSQKIDAIDRQLALLEHERGRLTLKSDRDGVVDGWQIRRSLTERPVHRGDPLLSVIEPDGPWRVETRLAQNRIDLVLAALRATDAKEETTAQYHRVALTSAPEKLLLAEFEQMGPVVDFENEEGPAAQTSFLIAGQTLPEIQTGAPATVAIDCGYRPLLFVAFQDFIRTFTGKLRMYL